MLGNIPGSYPDFLSVKYTKLFHNILKNDKSYAITDSKFPNIDRVCNGYSKSQLKKKNKDTSYDSVEQRKMWDEKSRKEQKIIEYINNFIKYYNVLSGKWKYSEVFHNYFVIIICGIYNLKRSLGYFFS